MKNNPCNCNGHQLTNFDPDTRTGICILCGETEISKTASRPGITHWRCSHAYGRKKEKLPGKEHVLLSIDEESKTGVCKTCGNIRILKAGKNSEGRQLWRCFTAVKKTAVPRKTNMKPKEHILSEINKLEETAICAKCGPIKIKPKTGLYKGKQYWSCCNKLHEMRTTPHRKASQRKANLRINYGITPEQYDLMFQSQKGCCIVCGRHQSTLIKTLAVDHDRQAEKKTGEMVIRGLLCDDCNRGLGMIHDNLKTLHRMIQYLLMTKIDLTQEELEIAKTVVPRYECDCELCRFNVRQGFNRGEPVGGELLESHIHTPVNSPDFVNIPIPPFIAP